MGNKYSRELQNNSGYGFYQSCSDGNVNSVRELLPSLSYDEVNYIDPTTGNTPLHVACLNNYPEIARLLLHNNICNRTIVNQNNKTAYDITNSQAIRSLFNRPQNPNEINRFVEIRNNKSSFRLINDNQYRPDNYITGYFSSTDARYSQLMLALSNASPLMKLFLYGRTERESKKIVRRLIETYIPITHKLYQRAHQFYDKDFLKQKSIKSLLTLYTLPTALFQALHSNADAYTVILYLHLRELSEYAFDKKSYRGMTITPTDLEAYRWAHNHAAIIETRTLQSTSKNREMAKIYAGVSSPDGTQLSTIVEYKFIQPCPTAVDLSKNISFFPQEEEVLLLPFTLFRVTAITETANDTGRQFHITMHNIPVTQTSLWAASKRNKNRN